MLSWFEEMLAADQFCPVLKLLYPDEILSSIPVSVQGLQFNSLKQRNGEQK